MPNAALTPGHAGDAALRAEPMAIDEKLDTAAADPDRSGGTANGNGAPAGWFALIGLRWASISRFEIKVSLLIGLLSVAFGLLLSVEIIGSAKSASALAYGFVGEGLMWLLAVPIGLLAWVLADRASGSPQQRARHLLIAAIVTAVVHAAVAPLFLYQLLGIPEFCSILECFKDKPRPPFWLRSVGVAGYTFIFSGLTFALLEAQHRRSAAARALARIQADHAQMNRATAAAQLAAMQAQVEPRFLFDSLVDIQALYERSAPTGATTLDRLIDYLRTALPRLREPGTTVGAEIQLIEAYLAVVAARHDGRPAVTVDVAADCRRARFYPMLLLPLVQEAVRRRHTMMFDRVDLTAERGGGLLVVELRIASGGLCIAADGGTDAAAQVRTRLLGLCGPLARLDCDDTATTTLYRLALPAEPTT